MKSLEELKAIKEKALGDIYVRNVKEATGSTDGKTNDGYKYHIMVCAGTGCTSSGSVTLIKEFERLIKEAGIENEVKIIKTGCFGLCAEGPIVVVYPEAAMYCQVQPADVAEIVTQHLVNGKIVKRLLEGVEKADDDVVTEEDLEGSDFFKKQQRVALHNCGKINPENIEEYIAHDGYFALASCY